MPEQGTIERAEQDAREGKSPSTQAGEFVREEIHHVREGKHGARSTKQAIAIGLSKARRAGVKLPAKKRGSSSRTRGKTKGGKSAVSRTALSRQAKSTARRRSSAQRSASARKAARTRARNR